MLMPTCFPPLPIISLDLFSLSFLFSSLVLDLIAPISGWGITSDRVVISYGLRQYPRTALLADAQPPDLELCYNVYGVLQACSSLPPPLLQAIANTNAPIYCLAHFAVLVSFFGAVFTETANKS